METNYVHLQQHEVELVLNLLNFLKEYPVMADLLFKKLFIYSPHSSWIVALLFTRFFSLLQFLASFIQSLRIRNQLFNIYLNLSVLCLDKLHFCLSSIFSALTLVLQERLQVYTCETQIYKRKNFMDIISKGQKCSNYCLRCHLTYC